MPHHSALLVQAIISGLFLGFLYALIAVGLNVIFGVVRMVNFAHGALVMLAMYAAFWLWRLFGIDPLFAVPLDVVILFLVGLAIYRLVVKRMLSGTPESQIYASFGVSVLLTSFAQVVFTADYRSIPSPISAGNVHMFGISIGREQIVAGLGAVLLTGLVYWIITKTETGRALQATAQDRQAASLMGINADSMFALAWGIGAACVGAAGALLMNFRVAFPTVGEPLAWTSFVVVALGGFGSVQGAFVAGLIVGVVEVVTGFVLEPNLKLIPGYFIYLLVLLIRPRGLMGRF